MEEINTCWDTLKGRGGWLQIKTSLPAASGAYFDYFFTCLTICVPEVPWEVGVGGGENHHQGRRSGDSDF